MITTLGSAEPRRRALLDDAVLAQGTEERTHGGDASSNGRAREAFGRERGKVAAQIGQRHRLGEQVALAGPAAQIREIALVGAARAWREAAPGKVAVEEGDCRPPGEPDLARGQAAGGARALARGMLRLAMVASVGAFYIHVQEGHIATLDQLAEADIITLGEDPELPWHRIDAPQDATTMWYAAMRKQERGIFLGTLTFRHGDHHSLLLDAGWEEIPVEEIGPPELR